MRVVNKSSTITVDKMEMNSMPKTHFIMVTKEIVGIYIQEDYYIS